MLEYLDLGNTEIGTETLIAIATVLRTNETLRYLNVENARVFSKEVREWLIAWHHVLGVHGTDSHTWLAPVCVIV